VNPAVLFLAGGIGLAVVLSAVVWLFSRPKKAVEDPNQARANLRALRHGAGAPPSTNRHPGAGGPGAGGPGVGDSGAGGIRVLGNVASEPSDPSDRPESGRCFDPDGRSGPSGDMTGR